MSTGPGKGGAVVGKESESRGKILRRMHWAQAGQAGWWI